MADVAASEAAPSTSKDKAAEPSVEESDTKQEQSTESPAAAVPEVVFKVCLMLHLTLSLCLFAAANNGCTATCITGWRTHHLHLCSSML
jgi:hypothetical protein